MQTTDVREAAQSAVDQSKTFLNRQVDERSTLIGQQVGSVAQELRHVGEQLGQTGIAGPVTSYVSQGADLVERLGHYLEDADSERLIADLEAIARRQPWAIAAGALVLGFAASRFLKTSSARRYRASDESYGAGYGGGTSSEGRYTTGTTGRSYGSGTSYGGTRAYGDGEYGAGSGRYAT
jgi:hypothetical protein